ncbi:plasmid transfer domain protein [Mycobacterium xenopi 3993]|nr:plasmid transfer domain protein [Mycobacterium xenopi 3993]
MRPDPRHHPGVGYMLIDGTAQPQRVRAFHVTDLDITTLARRFRLPPADPTAPARRTPLTPGHTPSEASGE